MNPLLIWRTIRHLRWEQIAYRPVRIAQFRLYRAFPRLASQWIDPASVAPTVSGESIETFRRVFATSFAHLNQPLEQYQHRLDDLCDGRFTSLNRTLRIETPDWNRRYETHLWNYHLHYFDHTVWGARALVERNDRRAWTACRRLIESWIAQARVGQSDGWDPYPVSLRTVSWMYAYALAADAVGDPPFLERWRAAIHRQLRFLDRHLEFLHLANHLLKNIKALVIGGLFFNRSDWLRRGERLLWREFDEQVLPDGGHYERAPMYHAQALADFLECFALLRAFDRIPNPNAIESKLRAMARFLDAMSYGDGTLALFNDSANARETLPAPILESANRVLGSDKTPSIPAFPETGYYLWQSPDGAEKIIVDAGPPAVEHNTAHAHCDLLSYELRLDGEPFIVDAGVHGYGGDRFREYCRSTRAHNTVMFDGVEQSEVWGTFRMARRAELLGVEVNSDERVWSFWGEYLRYDASVVHERHIRREANGDWLIADAARGGKAARARSFIHLHPSIETRLSSEMAIECRIGGRTVLIEPFGAESVTIVRGTDDPLQGWYFHDFGIAQPNAAILLDSRVKIGESFGYRIRKIN